MLVIGNPPPALSPGELDRVVSRVALYPDPLLAQVLTASTYWDQINDADRWAEDHHYLSGADLTAAISSDQLPWDPSVQALLAFPSVLDMMASNADWTQQLGEAFLAQPNDVEDAVQRMRRRAYNYGYLRSNSEIVVDSGPYVTIEPARRDYIVVPYYDPLVVYVAPRRGFAVGAAIRFGYGVTLGTIWAPWGWNNARFGWSSHVVYINGSPWRRTWATRVTYVHHYDVVHYDHRGSEHHEAIHRSQKERDDARNGRGSHEEHHHDDRHHR